MSRVKIGLLVCLLVLAGCNPFPKTWEWNQKLTVEVMTPEGLRSGSAVSHVKWGEPGLHGHYRTSYSGEATVIDLGKRGMLFALIGEGTKQIAAYTLHGELSERRADYEKLFPKIEQFRGSREVPHESFPPLVTFKDIDDPATVKQVYPDNLAASFGPGVSLKRITLEITDESVTNGNLEQRFRWWAEYSDLQLDGNRYRVAKASNQLANALNRLNFVKN